MLELTGVRHRYAQNVVIEIDAWGARDGEQWLLHGPSGCGKTTLLHIMAGLLAPTEGRVELAGQDLGALHGTALDRFRGQHVGIVFQRLHLIEALTVHQNLLLAQTAAGLPADRARVDEVLGDMALDELALRYPRDLSHGQAQRIALARALVNRPKLLLADEPTSNLDDANAQRVLALLRDQTRGHGATLVVASHDGRIKSAFDHWLDLPSLDREAA